jgi:hypothetical protein
VITAIASPAALPKRERRHAQNASSPPLIAAQVRPDTLEPSRKSAAKIFLSDRLKDLVSPDETGSLHRS